MTTDSPKCCSSLEQGSLTALRAALTHDMITTLVEPSRCAVFCALLEVKEADVGALASRLPQDRSVISRHLSALHDAGLVTLRVDGRRRVYRVRAASLVARLEALLITAKAAMAVCCPEDDANPTEES